MNDEQKRMIPAILEIMLDGSRSDRYLHFDERRGDFWISDNVAGLQIACFEDTSIYTDEDLQEEALRLLELAENN